MAMKRQDAWTRDDDTLLAEVILRHIREGGTQLSAFEEVAAKLGRTPAACGFRWNSTVRKTYEAAIQLAKAQRQKRSHARSKLTRFTQANSLVDPTHSLDQIIRFLRQHKNEVSDLKRKQKQLELELEQSEVEIQRLARENELMQGQLKHVQTDYRLVNDDYRTLVQIMDRARKMAYLEEEEADAVAKVSHAQSNELEKMEK
jgi:prespore-specific regulator